MRKSTTHFRDVSRLLSTTVDNGKNSVIPTSCKRKTSLWEAFPQQNLCSTPFIPHFKRSLLNSRHMSSTSSAVLVDKSLSMPSLSHTTHRLPGSLFNMVDRLSLTDLDYAIQSRNADKAWAIFVTLTLRKDEFIPLTVCCSLYALLLFAKRMVGFTNKATKLRQRQISQLLDYVQQHSTKELFLSSVQELPISSHKQLARAMRTGDYVDVWQTFYRFHKESKKGGMDPLKLPRNTCLKLMLMVMKDKSLNKNQIKTRLQLIALHGAGTSEYDSRYVSAADIYRLAYICHGYQRNRQTTHGLIDEFVLGLTKKKQSIRADALDELIWRMLVYGDIEKAQQVLNTVRDKVDVNEMVFINMMNAYRKQKKYHESLRLFEQLLEAGKQPTVKAFNAVLQIFTAQGSVDRASYIFESMLQLNVEPDAATYTEMIRINANAGHMKHCVHYYTKMLQSNIPPNVYTYSTLIEGACRKNDTRLILRWLHAMSAQDIQPNEVIMSSVLKSFAKQHMPEVVFEVAQQAAMTGIKTDAVLYTILLKMQAESTGIEGALKIHQDMLAESVEPNTFTYTTLIDICGKNYMPETAEKIFDLMKRSRRHKPNTVTYSVLIDAWLKAHRREKAESVLYDFLRQCKSDKTGRFWLDSRIQDRLRSRCCS
ncbi:uncharacterized protein B0P05DRAFT_566551 [Gilbertella persicaria]|uniref:uncharacterized protein n=1 Tax=Gilbertella persicaria TaxID=101096 RepID=UPI002221141F|nr:uncharacterized protein B0P05DRAFT_566551 [Gilbertella persicaria]KAI8047212.1 hypothetical protein B0P05DRAFT_566551 [Gilbertella persicaria]